MPLELFIAIRYLKSRRKGVFTFLTTLIAVGGITLGVGALIITLSVMSGFQKDIREKILGIQPHIVITKESRLPFSEYEQISNDVRTNKNVIEVSPFVYGQTILKNNQYSSGAVVKGIDLEREDALVGIKKTFIDKSVGSLENLEGKIILGDELAKRISAKIGDNIILMSPSQINIVPKMKKFQVAQLFKSGMYEYDSNLAYISISQGQELFDLGKAVSGLGVSVKNWEKANTVSQEIQESVSYPFWVRSWQRLNRNLFAALKLEKIMMFIILALIIIVAAFNIISNLLLLTVEKAKEIGILSAMGISRLKISKIFFYEGAIIGLSGIFMGVFFGTGISLLLKKYQFINLPADVYYLDALPVRIIPTDILLVICSAFLITIIAGIYPAYQVTKLDPLEAIRNG
ncbi:FtsX-like permease family protein [Elusimicrobiota bacterium]